MDAIEKFDPYRDNKFKTYAEIRIRGAILDELRAQDVVPRSVRDRFKTVEAARTKLEQNLARSPTSQEIAAFLDVRIEDLQRILPIVIVSDFDLGTTCLLAVSETPLDIFSARRTRNELARFIEQLPEQQRIVISLYYLDGLTLKEIGLLLEITESRVSQIHSAALSRLRRLLNGAPSE